MHFDVTRTAYRQFAQTQLGANACHPLSLSFRKEFIPEGNLPLIQLMRGNSPCISYS
jgi:hypothetical protein